MIRLHDFPSAMANAHCFLRVFGRYGLRLSLRGKLQGRKIVIGYIHGKGKTEYARALAKEFIEKFKENHKATCCKVLTHGFDFHSKERKAHCVNMVSASAEILTNLLDKAKETVKESV